MVSRVNKKNVPVAAAAANGIQSGKVAKKRKRYSVPCGGQTLRRSARLAKATTETGGEAKKSPVLKRGRKAKRQEEDKVSVDSGSEGLKENQKTEVDSGQGKDSVTTAPSLPVIETPKSSEAEHANSLVTPKSWRPKKVQRDLSSTYTTPSNTPAAETPKSKGLANGEMRKDIVTTVPPLPVIETPKSSEAGQACPLVTPKSWRPEKVQRSLSSTYTTPSTTPGAGTPKSRGLANGATARNFNVVYRGQPEEKEDCLLYTSPSPRDRQKSRMPSSA